MDESGQPLSPLLDQSYPSAPGPQGPSSPTIQLASPSIYAQARAALLTSNRPITLQLPFVGVVDTDASPMTQWTQKILGGPAPRQRRRLLGQGSSSRTLGSSPPGSPTSRSQRAPLDGSDDNNASSRRGRSGFGVASFRSNTSTLKTIADDGDDAMEQSQQQQGGGTAPAAALTESRVKHMQTVQAKLERAKEASRRAERNRHVIHDVLQQATAGVALPDTRDLSKLDRHNTFHPMAEKAHALSVLTQQHKERAFGFYLEQSMFAGI